MFIKGVALVLDQLTNSIHITRHTFKAWFMHMRLGLMSILSQREIVYTVCGSAIKLLPCRNLNLKDYNVL